MKKSFLYSICFHCRKQRLNSSIVGGVRIVTAGELRRRKEMKRLQEKKKGYCECCETKYDNLTKVGDAEFAIA